MKQQNNIAFDERNEASNFQIESKFDSSKLKLLKPSQYELSDSKLSPSRKDFNTNKEFVPIDDNAFLDIDDNLPSDECISINSIPTFHSTFNFSEKKGKKRNPHDHIIFNESSSVVRLRSERLKIINKLANQPSFIRESKVSTDFSPVSNYFLLNFFLIEHKHRVKWNSDRFSIKFIIQFSSAPWNYNFLEAF